MTGYPNLNREAFHAGADLLRKRGHVVFNPAEGDEDRPRVFLRTDLCWILDHAQAIALLPRSAEAGSGSASCIELALAEYLGLEVIRL